MLILRRALAWLAETAMAAALLGFWLRIHLGAEYSPEPRIWVQWWHFVQMTLGVFMLASGYLITTAACALSPLRNGPLWRYPMLVGALFALHLWFFSGAWTSKSVVLIYAGGVTIVFICAFVGNWIIRHVMVRADNR